MDCLKLVPIDQLDKDDNVAALVEMRAANWAETSAMLLDPRQCIRCGLCAARCPTEAVQMEAFRFSEEIVFEPVEQMTVND